MCQALTFLQLLNNTQLFCIQQQKCKIHVDSFISSETHLRVTLLQTIIKLEDTYNVHMLLKLIWTNILLDTFWTAIEWIMLCQHRASSCYTHFSGRMMNVWSRGGRRPHLHHKQNMQLKKYVTITVNHNALHTEFKKNFMSRYLEQVDFFAKQVSFKAHLPNWQRISPSRQ